MGRKKKRKNQTNIIGIIVLIVALIVYAKMTFLKDFNFDGINLNWENPFKRTPIEVTERSVTEDFSQTKEEEKSVIKEDTVVNVFFTKISNGKDIYVAVSRTKPEDYTGSDVEFAVRQLLKGATKYEKSRGVCSEIPPTTRLLSFKETPSKVIVNLSDDFGFGGGGDSLYKRVYQLIKTVNHNTRKPVYLYLNGRQADVIGGEGLMLKQPLRNNSLEE
ncbi:MAG: GerMN domain-containing protein [Cyanobacteria bacterium RUI128]|nr:GerMN domain-containing protein [Cyanobacteria bacterium RUI128]